MVGRGWITGILLWGGIFRPGELLASRRSDILLVLPSDTHSANTVPLLAIGEPKTRFSSARHQCARIESADILQLLELCFKMLNWLGAEDARVMEIYVQETSAARFMINLTVEQRTLFSLAHNFLTILGRSIELYSCNLPTKVWFRLFTTVSWCEETMGQSKDGSTLLANATRLYSSKRSGWKMSRMNSWYK